MKSIVSLGVISIVMVSYVHGANDASRIRASTMRTHALGGGQHARSASAAVLRLRPSVVPSDADRKKTQEDDEKKDEVKSNEQVSRSSSMSYSSHALGDRRAPSQSFANPTLRPTAVSVAVGSSGQPVPQKEKKQNSEREYAPGTPEYRAVNVYNQLYKLVSECDQFANGGCPLDQPGFAVWKLPVPTGQRAVLEDDGPQNLTCLYAIRSENGQLAVGCQTESGKIIKAYKAGWNNGRKTSYQVPTLTWGQKGVLLPAPRNKPYQNELPPLPAR